MKLQSAMFVLCTALGCHSPAADRDSWYTPLPAGIVACKVTKWNELERDLVIPVAGAEKESSIGRLDSRSFIALEFDEADSLTGSKVPRASGLKPYLLRALVLGEPRWLGLSVWYKGSDVFVHHGALGRSAVPMKRHPIIALLSNEPNNVYVVAGMAE